MDIKEIEKNTDSIIEYFDEIHSTNDMAKEIAENKIKYETEKESNEISKTEKIFSSKKDINEKVFSSKKDIDEKVFPNIVIAELQTKGKGTNGRVWVSKKGENILMTMIFYPECSIEKLDGITYKIAEMVKTAIKDLYDIELSIKLPNDLLLNNKKICGILTESSLINNKVNYLLIGIGFNVNQVNFETEILKNATSLKKEYENREFNREDIIIKIINNIKSLI